MATIETHIKTVTEVSKNSGDFTIHCFSDKKEDGTTTPSVQSSNTSRAYGD